MEVPRARVLYVQRPTGGGSATSLLAMTRGLDRAFVPVVLFHRPGPYVKRMEELGVETRILDPTPRPANPGRNGRPHGLHRLEVVRESSRLLRSEWPTARRIARLIRELRVDLVHHNNNPYANRASILAARLAGVPQVAHVRFLRDYFAPIDAAVGRLVDYYVYASHAVEAQRRGHLSFRNEAGAVVYEPFDLDRFARARDSRAVTRAALGVREDELLVSNVGRIVPWKGQLFFVEALARVLRREPRTRGLLVGAPDGSPASQAYHDSIRRRLAELGIDRRVTLAGFREDIAEIMAASDLVVHSASEPEPFGRVIVEAMAAGRPVVATAAGGPLEIVEEGLTGLLVPPGDPARMAEAILYWLGEPDRAREAGERALQSVRSRFQPRVFFERLARIYASALSRRESGRRPVLAHREPAR